MTQPALPLQVQKLDHAAWTVPNLDAAITFYGNLFGAKLLYRLGPIDASKLPTSANGKDWTEAHLGVAGARLHLAFLILPNNMQIELFQYDTPASNTTRPLAPNHIGAHHLGLLVDNLEESAELLKQHGCQVFEPIKFDTGPTAGVQFMYFTDPWGTIFELVQRDTPSSPPTSRECINPPSLYNSTQFGFSHAVAHNAGRTIHLAGQVAWDSKGQLVGKDDRIAQTRQALDNLKVVLKKAGAHPSHIVRLRTYLVGHTPEELGPICQLISEFYEGAEPAANTLISVSGLALPDLLVEIEATAQVG